MKQMPQDIKAEQSLLGAILNDPSLYLEAIVTEDDFYSERSKQLFSTIKELKDNDKPVDMVLVQDHNKNISFEYVNDCTTDGIITTNFNHWQDIILKKSKLRKYIEVCQNSLEMAFDGEDPQQELDKIENFEVRGVKEVEEIKDLVHDAIDHLKDSQTKTGYEGMETGIHLLDYKLDGLQTNKYILLAARPSMGKTALMLQIANGVSSRGKNVAIYSLEMTKRELATRMVIHQSQVHLKIIKDKQMGTKEHSLINNAGSNLMKKKIFVDDEFDQTISTIFKSAKRLDKKLRKKGEKLDLVMIDYIQLLNPDGKFDSDNKKVSHDSRQIKKIAKKLDTCVIALSQLSRACETRSNKRPLPSDLRDSGSLEQDADIIQFLYREDYYKEKDDPDNFKPDRIAEISISKNRGGETGVIKTEWNGGKQTFYNIKN